MKEQPKEKTISVIDLGTTKVVCLTGDRKSVV